MVARDVAAVQVCVDGEPAPALTVETKALVPGENVPRVAAFTLPADVETVDLAAVTTGGMVVPDTAGTIRVPLPTDLENQN